MKIWTDQYSGAVVSNDATAQFIKLVTPAITKFDTYQETDKAKDYESGTGENLTYSKFSVVHGYNNYLRWGSLQFHKLSDNDWVIKLTEDEFLADDYFHAVQDSSGNNVATFGNIYNNQIDLTDSDQFRHSYISVFEEAFCSIADVKHVLSANLFGNIRIGEVDSDDDSNLITYKYVYKWIRDIWAKMSIMLAKRYIVPITIQTPEAAEYLAAVAAEKIAYEIYLSIKRNAKFGELPDAITRMRDRYRKFEKDINKYRIPGIKNKIDGAGGAYEVARG